MQCSARQRDLDLLPVTVFIPDRCDWQPGKILCITLRYLFSSCRNNLPEVTKPIKQPDSNHIKIEITCFLQVIPCQQTKTSGIDFY